MVIKLESSHLRADTADAGKSPRSDNTPGISGPRDISLLLDMVGLNRLSDSVRSTLQHQFRLDSLLKTIEDKPSDFVTRNALVMESTRAGLQQPQASATPQPAPEQPTNLSESELTRRAQELYKSMKGGLFGCGTEEDKLLAALEGLSPDDAAKLREIYKEHYGEDLDSHLEGELSGTDLERAKALLSGDKAAAVADALHQAMDGAGTDEEAIRRILSTYKGDPQELERVYRERHNSSLKDDLKSELSQNEADEAIAYLSGDKIEAICSRLNGAMQGLGTDEEAIRESLKDLSKDELAAIEKRYKEKYGESLSDALNGDLSSYDLEEAQALRVGNSADAAAIRLKRGLEDESREQMEREFVGKSEAERQAILQAYAKRYGESGDADQFLKDAKSALSESDFNKVEDAVKKGEVSLAQRIHSSIDGLGTGDDIETLIKELGNLPEDQAKAVQEEYQKRYGESLKDALQGDLSGTLEDDALLYIDGLPKDPVTREIAIAKRTLQQIKNDREGFSVGNMILDPFTDKDERVDETARRLEQFITELESKGKVTAEDLAKLKKINSWANSDLEDIKETKNAAADTAATVGATVAAGAVIIGTAGTATPLVVAGYAAAAGAVGYAGGKALVKGTGYEVDGLAVDLISGGVDGAMNVVGAGIAAKATAMLGKGALSRAAGFVVDSAVDAGLGGAAGGATQSALQKETWNNGVMNGLETVIQSAAEQGVVGATTGLALKSGMSVLGGGLGLLRGATDAAPAINAGLSQSSPQAARADLPQINALPEETLRLAGLQTGEKLVVGRSGDIRINDPEVGRVHLTVERLDNGGFRLTDGEPASANGTFLNGRMVHQYVATPIRPGDSITLGETVTRLPPRIDPVTGKEHSLYTRLRNGQRIVVGRAPDADISIRGPGVSRKHAFISMEPDGRLCLYDGKPTLSGTEVNLNGKWISFDGTINVPSGTRVKIAGQHELTLPAQTTAQKFKGMEQGIKWSASVDPSSKQPISYADSPKHKLNYPDSSGHILTHGCDGRELANLRTALAELSPEAKKIFKKIEVVDDIGTMTTPSGTTYPIRALPIVHHRQLVVSHSALRSPVTAQQLFREITDSIEDARPGKFQKREFTQMASRHLEKRGYLDLADGKANFNGRVLIGHDTVVNGGTKIRSTPIREWITEPEYMEIVVDDKIFPEMHDHFVTFQKQLLKDLDPRLKGAAREIEILNKVHEHVQEVMRYDRSADLQVMDKNGYLNRSWRDLWNSEKKTLRSPYDMENIPHVPLPFRKVSRNLTAKDVPQVHLFDYIDRRVGVCEHQSLFASYLIEKLQQSGNLPLTLRISADTNLAHLAGSTESGGHAWTRATLSDGRIWIIDPAQKYVGPLGSSHVWLYQRPNDWINLLNRPF